MARKGISGELTPKQMRWVEEYLEDYNAMRATSAVYDCSTYASTKSMAIKLRNNPKVDSFITHMMETKLRLMNITKQRFAEELAHIALSTEEKTSDRLNAIKLLQTQAGWESAKEYKVDNGVITVNLIEEGDEDDTIESEQEDI